MAMLQSLDSLVTIPDNYAKTIDQANIALHKELETRMQKAGFAKGGGGFSRFVRTPQSLAKGLPGEWQLIPDYRDYVYKKPDLPTVKDSQGKEWNLANLINSSDATTKTLSTKGTLDPSELEVMVKLVQAKMEKDFKAIYDPDNPQDLETGAIAACGIRCALRATQATQAIVQQMAGSASGASNAQGQTAHQLGEGAKKAGYLVGDVEGGKFGEHHFWEFWNALQLKDHYDKLKAEGSAQAGSGHYALGKGLGRIAATGLTVATGGLAGGLAGSLGQDAIAREALGSAANFAAMRGLSRGINDFSLRAGETVYRNRDEIDQAVDVGVAVTAAVGAAFTGGTSAALYAGYAAAAYKASIGAKEGGLAGALAGAATGLLAGYGAAGKLGGFNLDLSYSYAEGWGAGIGYGFTDNFSGGLSYNDREGFGVTGSVGLGVLGKEFKGLRLNAGVNASGGYNAGLGIGNIDQSGRNSLNLGYRYSKFSGGTTSLSLTTGNLGAESFSTTGGLTYGTNSGFGVTAGVGWLNGDRTNNFSFGVNRRGVNASFSTRRKQAEKYDGWPGDPVPRRRGLLDIFSGFGYASQREDDNVLGMVAVDDAGEGPLGADERNQYQEGGALPDGVSTAKEFAHWAAADRAHHILISQDPQKYNNKATWERIRGRLKDGVNYSDAQIRALVAAEGGDAFNVNEGNVAVIKAGKWAAQARHEDATAMMSSAGEEMPLPGGDGSNPFNHMIGLADDVRHLPLTQSEIDRDDRAFEAKLLADMERETSVSYNFKKKFITPVVDFYKNKITNGIPYLYKGLKNAVTSKAGFMGVLAANYDMAKPMVSAMLPSAIQTFTDLAGKLGIGRGNPVEAIARDTGVVHQGNESVYRSAREATVWANMAAATFAGPGVLRAAGRGLTGLANRLSATRAAGYSFRPSTISASPLSRNWSPGVRSGVAGNISVARGRSLADLHLPRSAELGTHSTVKELLRSGHLPGAEGVILKESGVKFGSLFRLSTRNGRAVEFALTREIRDGKWVKVLYSGGRHSVNFPRDARLIAHTHPNKFSLQRWPSTADRNVVTNHFLRRLKTNPRATPEPSRVIWGKGDFDNTIFYSTFR